MPPKDATQIESKPEIHADLQSRITQIGRDLAQTLNAVLHELPGAPLRPMELAKVLKLNKDVSSRLLKATNHADPMAATQLMPGPSPLRRVLKAAQPHVPDPVIQSAFAAVDRFQNLIECEAEDRSAFDAMIAGWLPETRDSHDFAARQTAHRGFTLVKGLSADTNLSTVILHPSAADPDRRADFVSISGTFGLHRLQRDATARLMTWIVNPPDAPSRLTIAGHPIDHADDARLNKFCPEPHLELQSVAEGESVIYSPVPKDQGMGASANILLAEYTPGIMPLYRSAQSVGRGDAAVTAEITIPARKLILDAIVHEDVFPGVVPTAAVYDMIPAGIANPNDPARDIDRLYLNTPIRACGIGVRNLRTANYTRYTEMLEHVCRTRAWDPQRFRSYRLAVDYPLYGSQYLLMFARDPEPNR